MALEAAFRDLFRELRKLYDTLVAVRLTVVEDKPAKGETVLVDQLEDTVLDLMGSLNEALKAARAAQKGAGNSGDLNGVRRALTICQERFHRIERQFAADLVSYEKLKDLASLGSERRGAWLSWANCVKEGIEQCRQPLDAISKALAACWQEIAERVGMTSVSVTNTNIGQEIVAKGSALAEEMAREPIA
jgi:hypothetical protein